MFHSGQNVLGYLWTVNCSLCCLCTRCLEVIRMVGDIVSGVLELLEPWPHFLIDRLLLCILQHCTHGLQHVLHVLQVFSDVLDQTSLHGDYRAHLWPAILMMVVTVRQKKSSTYLASFLLHLCGGLEFMWHIMAPHERYRGIVLRVNMAIFHIWSIVEGDYYKKFFLKDKHVGFRLWLQMALIVQCGDRSIELERNRTI